METASLETVGSVHYDAAITTRDSPRKKLELKLVTDTQRPCEVSGVRCFEDVLSCCFLGALPTNTLLDDMLMFAQGWDRKFSKFRAR